MAVILKEIKQLVASLHAEAADDDDIGIGVL